MNNKNFQSKMLVKVRAKHIPDNSFMYDEAWLSLCHFAFTSPEDPWFPPTEQPNMPCSVDDVFHGAVIFVTAWGIAEFLQTMHHKLSNQYILLTPFYGPVASVAHYIQDPKIIAWFGQVNNDAVQFPKFTIIPLGLSWMQPGQQETAQNLKKWKLAEKKGLVYLNCRIANCQDPDRQVAYAHLRAEPYCKVVDIDTTSSLSAGSRKPFNLYMEEMANYKFTISPKGDMLDCYRHWEAILVGSIPICLYSALDAAFVDLPVLLLHDYREINEDFLQQKYTEIWSRSYNYDKLYKAYWINAIAAKLP